MAKKNSNSTTSATQLFLGIASLSAGAYHGYCDAQGIPFEKANLEWSLTYGPAIVQGAVGATIVGMAGLIKGTAIGSTSGWGDSCLEKIAKGSGGAVIGTTVGGILGGTVGGIKGGVQTLVGYGIGYLTGYLSK
ncbi:MAG: hypothetical protein PHU51_03810 [Candidatus Nanoarchaeia archaeon]|nr:hypothetical protein [Candidatus Nanoarchaeia archaeon]